MFFLHILLCPSGFPRLVTHDLSRPQQIAIIAMRYILVRMMLVALMHSCTLIVKQLSTQPCTPKDLYERTGLAPRTVSLRLKQLKIAGIVDSIPNLEDMRQPIYFVVLTKALRQSTHDHTPHTRTPPPKCEEEEGLPSDTQVLPT